MNGTPRKHVRILEWHVDVALVLMTLGVIVGMAWQ